MDTNIIIDILNIQYGTSYYENLPSNYNPHNMPEIDYPMKSSTEIDIIHISDSKLKITDILIAISNWGNSGQGDINGDGVVDVTDILEIVSNWGPCE